jgi:hypothetical protein
MLPVSSVLSFECVKCRVSSVLSAECRVNQIENPLRMSHGILCQSIKMDRGLLLLLSLPSIECLLSVGSSLLSAE